METALAEADAGFRAVLDILAEVFQVPVTEFRRRRRDSPLRGVAARFLCRFAGMTQRQIADLLQTGSGAGSESGC